MCVPGIAISRYIDLYTDFAFKKIFGTEANKDLLISFLNGLLDLEGEKVITDLTYLNTEQLGENNSDRRAIYDVYCQTMSGDRFIVEMQKTRQDYFKDRALYYSSFAIREQARKGLQEIQWNYHLSPVYVVGVLNFIMDDSKEKIDKVITKVTLKDDDNREFSDKLNFIFLEMPKFRKQENELETFIDKWLYVIKNLCRLSEMPVSLTEGIFKKLFSVAEIAAFTKEELYNYEESLKNSRDMYNSLVSAENTGLVKGEAIGLVKGEAIGLEKGKAIGLEKGEAIGIEKGEAKKTIEVARNMKIQGIDNQMISKISGMTVEEIEKL